MLAQLLFETQAYEQAVAHFERVAAAQPTPLEPASLLPWAEALIEVQRPVEAAQHLQTVLAANARSVRAQYLLAHAYALMGRDADARAAYDRGAAINANHPLAARVKSMLR